MPRVNELTPKQRERKKAKKIQKASKQGFCVASCVNSGLAMYATQARKQKERKPRVWVDRMVTPHSAGYLAAKALLEQRESAA